MSEELQKKKRREPSIYRKMTVTFVLILSVAIVVIGVVINRFCVSVIKEQLIDSNTRMLEEVEYEFKELYVQMNQLLTTLSETGYLESGEESTFERIRNQLRFEERVQNMVYLNGFYDFCLGVLFYDSDEQVYYVGGPLKEGYVFSEDAWFGGLEAQLSECTVIGPMPEQFLPDNVQKNSAIGFVKRKTGTWEDGNLPPFVMVEVSFEKIQEMLAQQLSSSTGYFLTDLEGNVLETSGLSELNWAEETLDEIKRTILESYETTQTMTRDGIILTSIHLENYDWVLSVAYSEQVLFRDVTRMTILVALFIGIVGFTAVLSVFILSKKILFPVESLKKMVDEIGRDDQTYLEEASDDEMASARVLLNSMKKKIQELTADRYILEVREQEAEIRMLQSQINPHFLHNTLDNIYCIAQIEEIEPIVVLTRDLSEMMRYSVNDKSMFATLRDELKHMEAYLEIINVRYGNGIRLEVQVPEELMGARVVKLLLQPLAENACTHGILPKPEQKGTIRVKAACVRETLAICVEDDGVGISEELCRELNDTMHHRAQSARTPQSKGFGIALVNVNDRIRLLDGMEYGLQISSGSSLVMDPEQDPDSEQRVSAGRTRRAGCCVIITQKYQAGSSDGQGDMK